MLGNLLFFTLFLFIVISITVFRRRMLKKLNLPQPQKLDENDYKNEVVAKLAFHLTD